MNYKKILRKQKIEDIHRIEELTIVQPQSVEEGNPVLLDHY